MADPHRVGRDVEHVAGLGVVESLAIDEEQGEALLHGQAREEVRRQRIALGSEQLGEARRLDLIGVIAELDEPPAINLGEGPRVERPPRLITMLLSEHQMECAAQQRGRLAPFADENIGEALEPRQHGNEPRPY
jgi:hypothetical protein